MFQWPFPGVQIVGNVRKCILAKLFQTTVALFVVILDFDGSLRPPRDHGFPTIPAKIATGSASISIGKGIDQSSQLWPVAVGSGWFHSERDRTSAHAEYLALLLGLEYLNNLTNLDGLCPWHFNKNDDADDYGDECSSLLVIRGDCKVVIDQMNGKSIPRKVQILHSRVVDLLCQLKTKFVTIKAKHVPRTDNALCDGLCITLMNTIEWQAMQTIARDFDCVATKYGFSNTATTSATKTRIPTTIPIEQLSPSRLLARHFQSESTCHIKYSSRQPIYDAIAWLSRTAGDTSTLLEVGKRQAAESLLVNDKRLLAKGIRHQIEGLTSQNAIKKSVFLKRKYRVLLSYFEDSEFAQGFDVDQFSLLMSTDAPLEWNHGSDKNWKNLVEKMHLVAMNMDWKEGSQLWVSTTT